MGETFGLHLMLDGYGCDRSRLESKNFVYQFLDEFPKNIGMTKLMTPYVTEYGGGDPGYLGLSGFVLIAESHVSIHTFPESCYVSIDVFSCRSFDTVAAECLIVTKFGITRVEKNILDRGVEYPMGMGAAERMVSLERDRCRLKAVGAG